MASFTAKNFANAKEQKVKPCKFFFKNGVCKFGDKCTFSHEKQLDLRKSPKFASNKGVKVEEETNEDIIALMEEVRIAEEIVRVAEVKQQLLARLAAAQAPAPVTVVVRKEKEKPVFSITTIIKSKEEFDSMKEEALNVFIPLISRVVTEDVTNSLCRLNKRFQDIGYYYFHTSSNEHRLMSVVQGIQHLAMHADPESFKRHFGNATPWKFKTPTFPPFNTTSSHDIEDPG